MTRVYLTRREIFSASHRLHAPQLSDSENQRLFEKCNHIHGHGHNYTLEVTVTGPVEPVTGLVFNLSDLKTAIDQAIFQKVDHKHLNLDVAEFKNLNPTVENMTVVFWKWLEAHLPAGLLYEVKVYETENNVAVYRGE